MQPAAMRRAFPYIQDYKESTRVGFPKGFPDQPTCFNKRDDLSTLAISSEEGGIGNLRARSIRDAKYGKMYE